MMPDGPSFLMRQLFPDNHESHACADKLAKTAKGFNYFTTEELEAQRKAFDEFRKSMDVLCKAFSAFANAIVEWEKEYHNELMLIKRRIEAKEKEKKE
jgi:hypothetical protein